MKLTKIEDMEQAGDCGMYKATLNVDNHGAAIEVIGSTLDECITRAVIIRGAFNDKL
jgi:hypothetical protein